jgi:hypothetical protein
MSHEDKAKEIERHFGEVLSKKQPRTVSLNWNELNYLTFNLAELEVEITEEKIKRLQMKCQRKMHLVLMCS